uniref:Apple domain-containing protein n=1 Tax=Plectus sambesii TaxID=2011161 RepID=A0A914UUH3_9BILA
MWLPIFLLLVGTTLSSGQGCGNFQQIADGVHVIQPFGETQKKTIVQSSDCAAACMASTDFVCTAYLWAWPNGDCVLLDKIDLTRQVFKDRQNYRLYAEACDGATPSIGFCQFEITQQLAQASASSLSPGMTSPSGCHDFCVASQLRLWCMDRVERKYLLS